MSEIRTNMIDDDQLFTGKFYKRKKKKVDIVNDIPDTFNYSYDQKKGAQASDTFVIPGRRDTGTSLKVVTDSELDFQPDDICVIDGAAYNITSALPIIPETNDLAAVRFGIKSEKLLTLDK